MNQGDHFIKNKLGNTVRKCSVTKHVISVDNCNHYGQWVVVAPANM